MPRADILGDEAVFSTVAPLLDDVWSRIASTESSCCASWCICRSVSQRKTMSDPKGGEGFYIREGTPVHGHFVYVDLFFSGRMASS